MNWLKEHFDSLMETAKDYFAGMSSKDKVTAGGIVGVVAITVANIIWGGGDDGSASRPGLYNGSDEDQDSE